MPEPSDPSAPVPVGDRTGQPSKSILNDCIQTLLDEQPEDKRAGLQALEDLVSGRKPLVDVEGKRGDPMRCVDALVSCFRLAVDSGKMIGDHVTVRIIRELDKRVGLKELSPEHRLAYEKILADRLSDGWMSLLEERKVDVWEYEALCASAPIMALFGDSEVPRGLIKPGECAPLGDQAFSKDPKLSKKINAAIKKLKAAKQRQGEDLNKRWLDTVVVTGHFGSGKSKLIERMLEAVGPWERRKVECSDSLDLAGSEFFGHAKGAFTGAEKTRGIFREADKGVIVFDDAQDLTPAQQRILLGVLESGELIPKGEGGIPIRTHAVCIFAFNDGVDSVRAGTVLREDFLSRLRGVRVDIPSPFERPLDLPVILKGMTKEVVERHRVEGKAGLDYSTILAAVVILARADGVLRKVQALLERCEFLSRTGKGKGWKLSLPGTDELGELAGDCDPVQKLDPSSARHLAKTLLKHLGCTQEDITEITGLSKRSAA